MAAFDNSYSRMVGWLKIILPLAALGLLSTLFLFNADRGTQDAIPFAEIEELAREQSISEPYFSGVAEDGSIVTLSARSAKPSDEGGLEIQALAADLRATDGTSVTMSAGSGRVEDNGRRAVLDGLVRVETSTGYRIETTGMDASLETGRLSTIGPLQARAPFGELTAGGLVVDSTNAGSQLLFTDGVRLVYTPDKQEP